MNNKKYLIVDEERYPLAVNKLRDSLSPEIQKMLEGFTQKAGEHTEALIKSDPEYKNNSEV